MLALLGLLYSGVVQAAISPPLNWVVLHPTALVPAFWVFGRLRGSRAFGAGWLVGASANAAIFYWIVHTVGTFTNLPRAAGWVVLLFFALAIGLYFGAFAWGFGAIRRGAGRYWPFGVAAWFAICEFVNPQLFPYYQGVAWYRWPEFFLIASVTGVAGVSFLVVACNAIVVQGIEAFRGSGPRTVVAVNAGIWLGLVAVALAVSSHRLDRIERAESVAPTLRVALVQPNYSVGARREMRRAGGQQIADEMVAMSREALERSIERGASIDVFVWPEKILLRSPQHRQNRAVRQFARETGVEIWTGGDYREHDAATGISQFFNSAFRVDARGRLDERYDKIILLPFGEFMPGADWIPALREIDGPGDYTPGTELPTFESAHGERFVFLICYEAIRSEFVGEGVRNGVDLLVNLTFDGWFGDTSEPTEHLMLAAVQSALYGVPMIRSTTTGISALIDARGVITRRTELLTRDVLVGTVQPMQVASLYARLGDWFAWACGAAALGLWIRSRVV